MQVIKALSELVKSDSSSESAKEIVTLMYDTALLTSGFDVDSPKDYAAKVYDMMGMALMGEGKATPSAPTSSSGSKESNSGSVASNAGRKGNNSGNEGSNSGSKGGKADNKGSKFDSKRSKPDSKKSKPDSKPSVQAVEADQVIEEK
jgi:hypothetical protein